MTRFTERAADRYGMAIETESFPEGTKTAADAAEAVGCEVGQIVKSVVLTTGEGEAVVVLTAGDHRVDTDALAAELGADRLTLADPETVRARTGYAIGGVPPFCHDERLPTYVDRTLLAHETVWAAAGTPETVFPVAPDRLRAITDATPIATFE
ncbi:MAG: YbaK/EbsC family protein [Halobaculum sp.]